MECTIHMKGCRTMMIVYCTIHKKEVARKVQRKVYCTIHKRRLSLNRKEVKKKKVPALLIKSSSIKSVKISTLRCSIKNSEVIYESSGN
uniref:StdB protein n=1 Tax=Klebsiella pneumoniae TaxID=573 RepID=A0A344V593_KLEPN|nr:StdB protein [Klebsiella pneumoniae]